MKKFDIDKESRTSDSLEDSLKTFFGEYEEDGDWFIVENPKQKVLDEVSAKIDGDELYLDIREVSVEKVLKNDMNTSAEDSVKAKNNFLEDITGLTVSDRKRRMRSNILPDKEWVDSNWNDNFGEE